MSFTNVISKVQKVVGDNAPLILTGIGVVGVAGTAYLSGKAALNADRILRDEPEDLPVKEKFKKTWKCYIPPVAAGATTIGAIVLAHRVGIKRTAALAAAYTISEKAYSEYKDRVVAKIGENQDEEIRAGIAKDRIEKNPPQGDILIVGDRDILCYDSITGRFFQSNMEDIRSAQNSINSVILNHDSASLSDFYALVGLSATSFTDELGWNTDNLLDVQFSTTLTPDGRPCLVLDYRSNPIRNYDNLR